MYLEVLRTVGRATCEKHKYHWAMPDSDPDSEEPISAEEMEAALYLSRVL